MSHVIVLDSGPLGLACGKSGNPEVDRVKWWCLQMESRGALLIIPEIADYEIRRELIRTKALDSIRLLNALHQAHIYLPISTAAMRKAAELWAEVRDRGLQTTEDKALDGDVILAAQALGYVGLGDQLVVATSNTKHLSRFLDARPWSDIRP